MHFKSSHRAALVLVEPNRQLTASFTSAVILASSVAPTLLKA